MINRFAVLALLFFAALFTGAAEAQTVRTCSNGTQNPCPWRYYFESVPCVSGTCTRSYEPTQQELQSANPSKGLLTEGDPATSTGVANVSVRVCAPTGMTLMGTGKIRLWTYYRYDFIPVPRKTDLNLADGVNTGRCGTPDGVTPLTCRCVVLDDVAMPGPYRYVIGEALNVGVSGSTSGTLYVDLIATGTSS